jgi:hypothetical protein
MRMEQQRGWGLEQLEEQMNVGVDDWEQLRGAGEK